MNQCPQSRQLQECLKRTTTVWRVHTSCPADSNMTWELLFVLFSRGSTCPKQHSKALPQTN